MSEAYKRSYSFSGYSKKSPGSKHNTGDCHLVAHLDVIGKGEVYHMLNGNVAIGRWGVHTFGMFVTGLLSEFEQVELRKITLSPYLSWLSAGTREVYEREP